MTTKNYLIVSTLIFAIVALVHLLRLVQGWPLLVGTMSIPLWMSMLAVLVSVTVVIWGVSLLRRV